MSETPHVKLMRRVSAYQSTKLQDSSGRPLMREVLQTFPGNFRFNEALRTRALRAACTHGVVRKKYLERIGSQENCLTQIITKLINIEMMLLWDEFPIYILSL